MTDGGALPAWFSRTIAGLREAGWLAATITTGQSFGGDLEAVTVHSGLLTARHAVGADVAIVAQGPGNLGTGTKWGYSGVAAGEAVNAAAALGGRPVASLRISFADPRERHQGVSHHSLTAYGQVALAARRRGDPRPPRTAGGARGRRRRAAGRAPPAGHGSGRRPGGGPPRDARSPCPPWAVRWTRTLSTSWRRRRPARHAASCSASRLGQQPQCQLATGQQTSAG